MGNKKDIKLEYYSEGSPVKNNWKVFVGGSHVGYLHEADPGEVGGAIDEDLMDDYFDDATNMALDDLKKRVFVRVHSEYLKHLKQKLSDKLK